LRALIQINIGEAIEAYRAVMPIEIRAGAASWGSPEHRKLLLGGLSLAEGESSPINFSADHAP
jgi:hypothetical protein